MRLVASPRLAAIVWSLLSAATAHGLLSGPQDRCLDAITAEGDRFIVRTLGALLVIFALTTGALDNGTRPAGTVRRSTLAAGALALLFIVAQIAQNFFSAEFGLVTGGVVAGCFLFAAAPLQRAMESMRDREPRVRSTPPSQPLTQACGSHDEAYRAAVRVALRDRRLTREEELALADIAERLGIGARRA